MLLPARCFFLMFCRASLSNIVNVTILYILEISSSTIFLDIWMTKFCGVGGVFLYLTRFLCFYDFKQIETTQL